MTVAFDFDGVLVLDAFPKIGEPNPMMIDGCKRLQELGVETVLWTSRVGAELQSAIEFCKDAGLKFTAINEPTPSNIANFANVYHGVIPRKVYADVYIDDHNVGYNELDAIRWLFNKISDIERGKRNG